jgi:hypothetical protein
MDVDKVISRANEMQLLREREDERSGDFEME